MYHLQFFLEFKQADWFEKLTSYRLDPVSSGLVFHPYTIFRVYYLEIRWSKLVLNYLHIIPIQDYEPHVTDVVQTSQCIFIHVDLSDRPFTINQYSVL